MSDVMTPTYDLAHQDAALSRRRALAEAMMKQAMEPLQQQTAGQHVVPISHLQGLSKLAQTMLSRGELDAVDRDTKAADVNWQRRLSEATSAYASMRASDPMGAFKAAMNSGMKPLQQMAIQDLRSGQVSRKDQAALYEKFTPESIAAFGKDPNAALTPLPKLMEVNSQVIPVSPVSAERLKGGVDARTTYGGVGIEPVTGIPMQRADTGEIKGLTGGNVTPERSANKVMAEGMVGASIKGIEKSHGEAVSARERLGQLATVGNALTAGAKTGPLTDARVYAAKLAEMVGLPYAADTPTETLVAMLGEGILEDARKLAPVTANDVQMLARIKGGSVTGTEALKNLVEIAERSYAKAITSHNAKLEGIGESVPGAELFKANFYVPVDVAGQTFDARGPAVGRAPAVKGPKFLGWERGK